MARCSRPASAKHANQGSEPEPKQVEHGNKVVATGLAWLPGKSTLKALFACAISDSLLFVGQKHIANITIGICLDVVKKGRGDSAQVCARWIAAHDTARA